MILFATHSIRVNLSNHWPNIPFRYLFRSGQDHVVTHFGADDQPHNLTT
jgi:hypothetical protein